MPVVYLLVIGAALGIFFTFATKRFRSMGFGLLISVALVCGLVMAFHIPLH